MTRQQTSGKRLIAKLAFASLATLLLFLTGYHFFYSPPKHNTGITHLENVFRHHNADIWVVKFFPAPSTMASCSVDGTVKIFRRADGKVLRVLQHPQGLTHMDISNDGRLIATTSYDQKVRVWDAASGQLIQSFNGHIGTPWAVHFSPDAQLLLSSGEDQVIRIWDLSRGTQRIILKGHTRNVWDARFSPDGKTIASGSYDSKVKIWDLASGHVLKTLDGHSEAVVALIYSPDGKLLATASDDKTINLWRTSDYGLLRTLEQPEHAQAVAFSPDNRRLLTSGRDKTMTGELLQSLFGDTEYNKGISARIWDVASGEILQTFSEHSNDANDVAWSCDGRWIASGSSDKTIGVYRVLK